MVIGGKNSVSFVVWQAAFFPTTETKSQVKRIMKGGWVQVDLYIIIISYHNNHS